MRLRSRIKIEYLINQYKILNDKIPTLNQGGCGIFAEEAYNLFKMAGFNVSLAVVTPQSQAVLVNTNMQNNASLSETPFYHIVLVIEDKFIDSNGIWDCVDDMYDYRKFNCTAIKGLTIDLLKVWNNETTWNWMFYRNVETYTELIKRVISTAHKKYRRKYLVV